MLSRVLIFCVRAYQMLLSPLIGNCCRFEPSCSVYCIEALRVHGAWRGLGLAGRRLLRCHPFGPCGHDPVPPPRKPESHQRSTCNVQRSTLNNQVTARSQLECWELNVGR